MKLFDSIRQHVSHLGNGLFGNGSMKTNVRDDFGSNPVDFSVLAPRLQRTGGEVPKAGRARPTL